MEKKKNLKDRYIIIALIVIVIVSMAILLNIEEYLSLTSSQFHEMEDGSIIVDAVKTKTVKNEDVECIRYVIREDLDNNITFYKYDSNTGESTRTVKLSPHDASNSKLYLFTNKYHKIVEYAKNTEPILSWEIIQGFKGLEEKYEDIFTDSEIINDKVLYDYICNSTVTENINNHYDIKICTRN